MFARIIAGRVARVTEDMPELAPGECAQIVECGAEAQERWLFAGGACVAPPEPTPAEINAAHNAPIDAQILALEAKQARPLREHTLALAEQDAVTMQAALMRIQALDAEIAELRSKRAAA